MSLSGDLTSLTRFSSRLRKMPTVVGQKVATAAAPALTAVARGTFNAGEDPYGVTWDPLRDGSKATLKKTGGIERGVFYVAIGTLLRVRLAAPYAKYQVGKRHVFPTQGSPLPTEYVDALKKTTNDVLAAEVTS